MLYENFVNFILVTLKVILIIKKFVF